MSFLLLACLLACGLKRYLPAGPALRGTELSAFEADLSPPACTAPAATPVLPLQIFGLYYDLDLVVVSRGTGWDMHEYARVRLPDGELWLAKDSRPDGVQTITAAVGDIEAWVPEAAVPRRRGEVEVSAVEEGRRVALWLAYTNPAGQAVRVEAEARVQDRPPGRRNGSTMGHSRQAAAVALDLERFGPARRVRMELDGQRARIRRLLGLVPFRYLLAQAQGGIMVADQVQRPVEGGFELLRPGPGAVDPATGEPGWPTASTERWTVEAEGEGRSRAVREDGRVRLVYHFVQGGLARAEAWQAGRELPVTVLHISPPLPDLGCGHGLRGQSRFRLDINGQEGQGTGTIEAVVDEAGARLAIRPTAPWWLADRPMDGEVLRGADGSFHLRTRRVEGDAEARR